MDKGTIVSRTNEYYLEEVASYTIQDFTQYFYSIMPMDKQAKPPSAMIGMFNYKVNQYGIDKLLFMTDIYAQNCIDNNSIFVLSQWDDYSRLADEKLAMAKNVNDNKKYYVPRNRKELFEHE